MRLGMRLLLCLVVDPQLRDGLGGRLIGGLPLAGLQPGQIIVDQRADLLAHQEADHQVAHSVDAEEEVEQVPQHAEGANGTNDDKCATQDAVGNH